MTLQNLRTHLLIILLLLMPSLASQVRAADLNVTDIDGSNFVEIRLDDGVTVWDVQGGESGDFDIELVVNPNGPTGYALTIDDVNGFWGIWNTSPSAQLHVKSPNEDSAKVLVQNTVGSGDRVMFELNNNSGAPQYDFVRQTPFVALWRMEVDFGGQYRFCMGGAIACGLTLRGVDGTFFGNSFAANHVNTSSRELKEAFKPIEATAVLEKLVHLPVTEWQFKQQSEERHVGPVAEDFQAAFGLGDGKHISTTDAQGIAFAAIQGLHQLVEVMQQRIKQKDMELEHIQKEKQVLDDRLAVLEAAVAKLQIRTSSTSLR